MKSKDKITGVTIHFINHEYDRGPIIMQERVVVKDDDDPSVLSRRVLKKEYSLYLKAIKLFCTDKIKIEGDKVIINE